MEAAINTAYACQIFQGTCVAFAMMAQVFVGRWYGALSWTEIGPGTWQFIWFSLLSMFITVPLSLLYGMWYFQGTDIQEVALPYFYLLVGCNFLYPLSATLSCFFLGQGKTKLVLFANLGAQAMKILFGYFLIFGLGNWIPSFGIMGGALSTMAAQILFCALLLSVFLNKHHRLTFHSHQFRFRVALFFECITPCCLRALNRILNFTSWAAIAHLMVAKGGDYLLILSIGGALFLFLPFLFEALCQAETTIFSQMIGAKQYDFIPKALFSGFFLVIIVICILSIPLLFFPLKVFSLLFPSIVLAVSSIKKVFFGIWISASLFTLGAIPLSFVLACKDMKFSLFMGCLNWVNGYLLMYGLIVHANIAADQFWLCLAFMHGTTVLIYIGRMRILSSYLAKTRGSPI